MCRFLPRLILRFCTGTESDVRLGLLRRRPKTFLLFVLITLTLVRCETSHEPDTKDIAVADVAVYSDQGCWAESVRAAEKMFEWMGYAVQTVNAEFIRQEGLDGFNVVCVPGGDMYQYAHDLSSTGVKNIKNFIRKGGGYIGICGGAYFAGERVFWRGEQLSMTPLALFEDSTSGPLDEIVPYPDYGMCQVNVVDTTHAITASLPGSAWMLYYWGPTFTPSAASDVTVLATYSWENKPAILTLEYGSGRVFLIGTHPEIEEDSERDDVTWGDELDDHGSDWELMKRATEWCLAK